MRTIYFDMGELNRFGALGLLSSEAKVLPAGTVIHTEQAKIRKELPQYQEMAKRAGVFFFFEDEDIPNAPFFTVPYMELVARDRDGRWYGRAESIGDGVYCVTPDGAVFLVSEGMERFSRRLLAGEEVRELWEPALELTVYPSKEAAAQVVELVPLEELLPKGWEEREK